MALLLLSALPFRPWFFLIEERAHERRELFGGRHKTQVPVVKDVEP
jgi:hypothetical protein